MKKERSKKEGKLKKKIKEMKKTAKGKAILKLIGWGIFFFIILIFCLVAAIIAPNTDAPKKDPNPIEVPKVDNEEQPNEQILTTNNLIEILKPLKEKAYDYEIKIKIADTTYIYNGHKDLTTESGYKESSTGIIKYFIDNTGIYQETPNEKIPLTNLYEGLDLNYMNWSNLFSFIMNKEYNLIDEKEYLSYHMSSEVMDIYLTMTKEKVITNIKITQKTNDNTTNYEYDFAFKNIANN